MPEREPYWADVANTVLKRVADYYLHHYHEEGNPRPWAVGGAFFLPGEWNPVMHGKDEISEIPGMTVRIQGEILTVGIQMSTNTIFHRLPDGRWVRMINEDIVPLAAKAEADKLYQEAIAKEPTPELDPDPRDRWLEEQRD